MLTFEIRAWNGVTVCALGGDLDAFTASRLREVMAAVAKPQAVIIDLAGVVFIDSSGLGAIVGGVRRVRELGGQVALCAPLAPVARVLRVAGLNRIVPVTDTRDEALAALQVPTSA